MTGTIKTMPNNNASDADLFDTTKVSEDDVEETKTEEPTKPAETTTEEPVEKKPEDPAPVATDAAEEEVLVELPTGDKVKVEELVGGYMKEKDYRQKTMALAEERKRLETERLQYQAILQNQAKPAAPAPAKNELEGYDQAQIEEFKKIARATGFVSKEELDALKAQESQRQSESSMKQIVGNFYAQHPDYTEQNDPDGIKHKILNEALELYDWRNPSKMASALEKAHSDAQAKIQAALGGVKSAIAKTNVKAAAVGAGGGAGVSPKVNNQNLNADQLAVLKDFGLED